MALYGHPSIQKILSNFLIFEIFNEFSDKMGLVLVQKVNSWKSVMNTRLWLWSDGNQSGVVLIFWKFNSYQIFEKAHKRTKLNSRFFNGESLTNLYLRDNINCFPKLGRRKKSIPLYEVRLISLYLKIHYWK